MDSIMATIVDAVTKIIRSNAGGFGNILISIIMSMAQKKSVVLTKIEHEGKIYSHYLKVNNIDIKETSIKVYAIDKNKKRHDIDFFYGFDMNYQPCEIDSDYVNFVVVKDGKETELEEGEGVVFADYL